MTMLQLDNMIHALKQHKKYEPTHTLEQARAAWKQLSDVKRKK